MCKCTFSCISQNLSGVKIYTLNFAGLVSCASCQLENLRSEEKQNVRTLVLTGVSVLFSQVILVQVNPGETFTIRAEDGTLQCIQGKEGSR